MATDEEQIKEHCTEVAGKFTARNQMNDDIEAAVMLEQADEAKPRDTGEEAIKITTSPMARTMANGAINLMSASKPTFSMPAEKNNAEAQAASSLMEQVADAVWSLNSFIQQVPLENDLVTSGILFGEVCGGVSATKDMLEAGKGGPKASMKRLESIAETVPYFFEIWDPRTCYPEEDALGLVSFHRKTKMKSGEVMDKYGSKAVAILGDKDKRYDDVVLIEFWDNAVKAVWLDGRDGMIAIGEHNLPVIPIVAQTVNGSRIYSKPEYRRQPFLYGLLKSGIWYRQSLALTVMYHNLFTLGAWPEFIFEAEEGESLEADLSTPGVFRIKPGQKFTQLEKKTIDQSMKTGLDMAMSLGEETTMYKQALGQPVGGSNASYSMVSLLNQAGRLPLVPQQRRGSMGVAKFAEIMFKLWKDGGKSSNVISEKGSLELKPKEIPKSFIIEASLEIDMPQDDRLNAQIAGQVSSGENQLTTKEYARRKYLKIGQSDEMDKAIQKEKINDAIAAITTQNEIQRLMAEAQKQMMPQADPNSPQTMPPGSTGATETGLTPQQAPQIPQQPQNGAPVSAGQPSAQQIPPGMLELPPEQLQQMMDSQGIPPDKQAQIRAMLDQQRQQQGPQGAQAGLPQMGPSQATMG